MMQVFVDDVWFRIFLIFELPWLECPTLMKLGVVKVCIEGVILVIMLSLLCV